MKRYIGLALAACAIQSILIGAVIFGVFQVAKHRYQQRHPHYPACKCGVGCDCCAACPCLYKK